MHISIVSLGKKYTAVCKVTGAAFAFNSTKVFAHSPDLSKALKYCGRHLNSRKFMFTKRFDPWRIHSIRARRIIWVYRTGELSKLCLPVTRILRMAMLWYRS